MKTISLACAGTLPKPNTIPVSLKNRPRIPTPDVTKEVVDREQRLALSASNVANAAAGVAGMIPPPAYHPSAIGVPDAVPMIQVVSVNPTTGVVLSPIQGTCRLLQYESEYPYCKPEMYTHTLFL